MNKEEYRKIRSTLPQELQTFFDDKFKPRKGWFAKLRAAVIEHGAVNVRAKNLKVKKHKDTGDWVYRSHR